VDVICVSVGRVIRTLPRGNQVLGVTSLDNLLYVLRDGTPSSEIEVYDKDSYRLQRKFTVRGLDSAVDIVACSRHRCAYISDDVNDRVHRVALPADAIVHSWPVDDIPAGLSVTDSHSVLVTCPDVSKIKEFSTDGQLLCQLQLPGDIILPWHTVQLSSGQFIVCHGTPFDKESLHRVCLLGSDGQVVKSYGGLQGSGNQYMAVPIRLAVDRNQFVFVADRLNDRVLVLSPSLTYMREFLLGAEVEGWFLSTSQPTRLCLNEDKKRLYVADTKQVFVVSM